MDQTPRKMSELDLDDESKPGKIMKKQTNKGPVEMKCSRKQLLCDTA